MIELKLDDIRLQQGLGTLLKNAAQTAPIMRGLAEEMKTLSTENFENFENQAWGNEKWERSSAAEKRSGHTLTAKGELRDSISTRVLGTQARIGTNLKYAAIHHLGGTILPKNKPYLVFPVPGGGLRKVKRIDMPARPYLPVRGDGRLQPGAERRLLDVALAALKRGL